MICIKKVLLSLCVCMTVAGGIGKLWAIEKSGRNFHEFELWHKLLQYSLSPNGEWAMWRIQSNNDSDTLFIQNIKTGKEYKYEEASAPVFSADSRWAVFSQPDHQAMAAAIAYGVKLVNLATAEEKAFKSMESFSFTKDSKFLILKGTRSGDVVELNLYDLENKVSKNIANVREYTPDPTGKYLAYIVKTATGQGNGVEVIDLSDFHILFPENEEAEYEKLKWTDKGLVFMKILPDSVEQSRQREIHVIRNLGQKQQVYCLSSERLSGFPADMKISEFYAPHWSSDGKILFFGIAKQRKKVQLGQEDKANVDVWHWQDQEIQSRQKSRYYLNRSRTYLCAWQPAYNEWRQLTDSALYDVAAISTDGTYVLAEDDGPYRPHYREPHCDIYVIETATGKRTRLLENTILAASFSRDGKYAYYFRENNWWAYELRKGKYINLTEGISVVLSDTHYDGPIDIPPSYGVAGWLKEDNSFWFYDEYDIWSVEPATLKLNRLTRGREKQIRFRKFQRGELTADKNLLLSATGDDGQTGIYRYDPQGKHRQLIYGGFSIQRLEQSVDKKICLMGKADNITSPELYVCDEKFQNIRQLTHTNLSPSGYVFRKSELIRYENSKGKALKGALFYPVNYQEGKQYPMIVHIYETLSDQLNGFVFPSARETYNSMNYVLQGYFVFQPDITYETNHPGESAADCVMAAVLEVLKRKDIDPARLGLIGHSWGAYQTAYIVTQTSLFAAAVAGAPLTNMISMYNSIYWEDGRTNQEMFETSQARFRLPWWLISEQYIKNSPVFQAERIHTPLLILFGTEDNAVGWSQGLEMYITMRRLGKPCILLAYQDEGHTIGGKANVLDQTNRVAEYFGYYLQGKAEADWIMKGCTYLEKKGE